MVLQERNNQESEKTYEKGADFSEKIACERRLDVGRYLGRLWLR
jgi:hypothetical protein